MLEVLGSSFFLVFCMCWDDEKCFLLYYKFFFLKKEKKLFSCVSIEIKNFILVIIVINNLVF